MSGLEFDVLVPWAASATGPYMDPVDPAEAGRRMRALRDRVHEGSSR